MNLNIEGTPVKDKPLFKVGDYVKIKFRYDSNIIRITRILDSDGYEGVNYIQYGPSTGYKKIKTKKPTPAKYSEGALMLVTPEVINKIINTLDAQINLFKELEKEI